MIRTYALNALSIPRPYLVIAGILIALIVFLSILYILVSAKCVFDAVLCRKKPKKWSRKPSRSRPDYMQMYNIGLAWRDENASFKKDVHIVNDELNLYGEYYDFGNDKCMIMLPGRAETLEYGYYFSRPYVELGYNVLLIDPRAHGMSDGKFNTVGYGESGDVIAWARFLHEQHTVRSIILHASCVGCSGAMLAVTSDNCPDYIDGVVAEGMFATFGESMKEHLIHFKQPVFPLYNLINMWKKHYLGRSMDFGPIDVIEKMNKPLLMLHSKEDIYSTPELAQKLYDLAPGENKKLVWFEHGYHSMLRITDTEKYDSSLKEFISEHFSRVEA